MAAKVRGSWALAVVLMSLTSAASVCAQDLDEAARTHFESGRTYYETGDYENAIREFTQSYELSHRAGLLLNISGAYERLGQLGNAIEALERYLRDEPNAPERATLELRLNRLRVRYRGRGQPEGPGPPLRDPDAPASSGGGDGLILGGAIAYAIGGAGLVLMAVFGGLAAGEDATLSMTCDRTCTDAELANLFAYTTTADVGLALALAGVAVGTVLVILGATSAPSTDVALAPWITPDGLGLVGGGRF